MTSGLKLIIFDCDGTLVDSQHLIVRAMQLAFEGFDLAPPLRTAILRTVGLSIPETIAELAPGADLEIRQQLGQAYRDWNVSLRETAKMQEPMFKGAQSLLLDLAAREDIILGIATGKSRRGVMRFLEHNSLDSIFLTVQTADDAPSKPHPAMLLQAMQETGVSSENTLMIGDTTYDMAMAVRAFVKGIGVSWGHHTAQDLVNAGAQAVAGTFADLGLMLPSGKMLEIPRAVAA